MEAGGGDGGVSNRLKRNQRAYIAAVPMGVALCLAVLLVVGGICGLLDQSGLSDMSGPFGFVILIGALAFPLAFAGGYLLGLPVASLLERHVFAVWAPVFAVVWGGFCGWVVSALFWAFVIGGYFDLRMQPMAAMFGSPFGVSIGLCWWYLRRRLEIDDSALQD